MFKLFRNPRDIYMKNEPFLSFGQEYRGYRLKSDQFTYESHTGWHEIGAEKRRGILRKDNCSENRG